MKEQKKDQAMEIRIVLPDGTAETTWLGSLEVQKLERRIQRHNDYRWLHGMEETCTMAGLLAGIIHVYIREFMDEDVESEYSWNGKRKGEKEE